MSGSLVHNKKGPHMSAQEADKFEEALEGDNFGDMDDWEAELAEKIIKTKLLIGKNTDLKAAGSAEAAALLEKKLALYQAALSFMAGNLKVAATVGSQGGVKGIIAYLRKQATEDAAKIETQKYSNMIMEKLPGFKLAVKTGNVIQQNGVHSSA
jgi:pyoverdine/dityrosine biosynthesis protein Dit1